MQVNLPDYFADILDAESLTLYNNSTNDSILSGYATISNYPVSVAVSNFKCKGGSLGVSASNNLILAIEQSFERKIPLIVVIASGGIRVHEGLTGLLQMTRTMAALQKLKRSGIPTIGIFTNPTMAGVLSSYASALDIIIAEPGSRIGFTGIKVLKNTPLEKGVNSAQISENYLNNGFIDAVINKSQLQDTLTKLLSILSKKNRNQLMEKLTLQEKALVIKNPDDIAYLQENPWQIVRDSRNLERKQSRYFLDKIFNSIFYLEGDRISSKSDTLIGGLAELNNSIYMVLAIQKGNSFEERKTTNFGMCKSACYRKGIRLMKLAEQLSIPVVCFVDTPGADASAESERNGIAYAISLSIETMLNLKVPTLSFVIGEGGSGGALACTSADTVFMLEKSTYSVITPEGYASILWNDKSKAPQAAEEMHLTAYHALKENNIDGIVLEDENLLDNMKQIIQEYTLRIYAEKPLVEMRHQKHLRESESSVLSTDIPTTLSR